MRRPPERFVDEADAAGGIDRPRMARGLRKKGGEMTKNRLRGKMKGDGRRLTDGAEEDNGGGLKRRHGGKEWLGGRSGGLARGGERELP